MMGRAQPGSTRAGDWVRGENCFELTACRTVRVRTGSRIHFGLWTLESGAERRYGGVGVMVEEPRLELVVEETDIFRAEGLHAERVRAVAEHWACFYQRTLPACCLRVTSAPPMHVGLGVGTQLAMATAAALHAWCGELLPDAETLALSTMRGRRSAVGVYGFLHGGMIVESGKTPQQWLSPLEAHVLLPAGWRFLLVRPASSPPGLYGEQEEAALARLEHASPGWGQRLADEARQRLVPAARAGDFAAFSQSLRRYAELAGDYFRSVQGGRYRGALLQQLIDWLHGQNVDGCGQSSWGPTVFAVVSDQGRAEELREALCQTFAHPGLCVSLTAASTAGAQIWQTTDPAP